MNYWQNRMLRAQYRVADKSIAEINRQLAAYYRNSAKATINDMENLYLRLLAKNQAGTEILASDLYRLDKYYVMLNKLNERLSKMSGREVNYMEKRLSKVYEDIYKSIPGLPNLQVQDMFTIISEERAKQCINAIWCADGKTWSQRIWGNMDILKQELNDELVSCVITGKKTTYLKQALQERFNVSYKQAQRLVSTEITHIQTQTTAQRYKDAGITQFEVITAKDNGVCDICEDNAGTPILLNELVEGVNAPPFHPNCRCAIVPVLD